MSGDGPHTRVHAMPKQSRHRAGRQSSASETVAIAPKTPDHRLVELLEPRLLLSISNALDEIDFGNLASEAAHHFDPGINAAQLPILGAGSVGASAALAYRDPTTGSAMTFTLGVDPNRRDYFTVKLWGNDPDQTINLDDTSGDVLQSLEQSGGPVIYPNRFYYYTVAIPISMTQGQTSVQLELSVSAPGKPIYSVYSGTSPEFVPSSTSATGTSPTVTGQATLSTLTDTKAMNILLANRETIYNSGGYYSTIVGRQALVLGSENANGTYSWTQPSAAPEEVTGLDMFTNLASWMAANPNATEAQWDAQIGDSKAGPGYTAFPDELMSVLTSTYLLPALTDPSSGSVLYAAPNYHNPQLMARIVAAMDGSSYLQDSDGGFTAQGGGWTGLTPTSARQGTTWGGGPLEGVDAQTLGWSIIQLLNDATAGPLFQTYLGESYDANLNGGSVLRATAYEEMLYNHIQYLTWATGGTESQNSFETLDYYATDLALRKLQALYPNASYANTAGTGVNRIEQLLGLIPDTMGGGVGFNYYSPYATSTYTNYGLTADGLGEAHGALSSGFDGGGYGQLIPWIATQVASMAALDPQMTAAFPGTNSTILSLVEAKANATINSFDQFISPTYNATVNSSGVVTSDTYGFDPESWITYRDPKNPNTYAGGFNFNSQYLASQPNGALDNSFALRSAYLETQYNITPTTGVTFGGAISNSTLDYLRSLSAYEATIKSLIGVSPSSLTPIPDEPGQPGYTFADVQNGAVAIVNNGEQLFMNIDWRNYEYNNNSLVNLVPSQVLRYDYTTSTIEQAGQVQLPYNSATVQSDGNLSATSMFGVDVARLGNYLVILNDSTSAYSATLPVGTGLAEDLISRNLYDLSSTGSAPTTVSVAAGKAAILWLNASSVISSLGTGSDVGTVGVAGSDSYSGGVYTNTGAGADMGETADAFHFVPTSASGNATITAQVLTQTAASSLAQAGVMVRDGTSASAAFAAVLRTPGGGVRFVYRTTARAAAAWVAVPDPLSPVYVKLTRSGNNVSGYYSINGIIWTQIGSTQSIAMTAPEIGLAVSSHSTTATSTATFGSITVNAAVAPTVGTAASASATTVTGTTVNLSVLGADAGGQSGLTYTWTLSGTSPDQVAFSANGTNAAQSTTVTFSAAGTYNFVATIANASGASVTSTVSVTVAQKLTSISVSSATAVVPSGNTDLFYANESDQFGMPMKSPAALTWSVTSGGIGSIDQSGLYTAPASIGGLATVLATSGTLSGTSTITVQAPIGIFTGTQAINTSPAGSASYNSTTGTYAVSGSGSDIWGTSDQFQYDYESLTGDGTVTAYVASMTDTNVWTKCGIMVRDALSAGGAYAFLMTTPTTTEGDAFQYRSSDGASAGQDIQTTGTGTGGPEWLRLTRAGNTFTAYLSTNGTTWTAYGTPQTITMGSTIYVGLVVSSHVNSTLATATFTNVSVAPATRTFGANQDIGNPSPTGSYSESNGTITLSGGGSDIYGTSDQFQYGYNEVTGNGSLITEVDSVTNTNTYTKAGIMLRNTLAANSANVSLFLTPPNGNSGNGIGFEWRSSAGGNTSETVATGLAAPYWLKLTDTNGSFTAFYSPTGASWTQIGSAEAITMNADIFAGVAVTAHVNGSLATATFNNVSSTLAAATIPPPSLSQPPTASANPVTGKTVVLSATATDPIEGTSNLTYTWSALGEPPANMTFSANGTNAAANTTVTFTGAGTYLFQVTVQDLNGLQVTGTVAVTVNQTLTSIAVTPATSASPSVGPGGSIGFSAIALDQFGLPMATQPTLAWSASSGTINALSGAYTAAANAQGTSNVTITANSSPLSGTTTLSVVNQAPLIALSSGIAVIPSTLAASLSLAAVDDGGSANLSYQWSATGLAAVSFSANNSNAAASTVATFSKAGTYTVTAVVTDLGAASTTTSTSVTVDPVWLSPTSIATWNPSTGVLTVTGPASIIADPGTDEPIIEASGTAAVVTLDPSSGTDIHIGGLSLTDDATATETSLGSARSATNYHILVIGTTGATAAPMYMIDSTSTLDLADNDMAILYGSGTSPMPLVSAELSQAYDGGLWNQPGLTSIARVNPASYGLGCAEASALGATTFDGVTLGGNAVLVKYTLLGDANLDGTVNFGDFSIVQNHYGHAGGWSSGDFNYDGTVNFEDFSLLQNNYGSTAESNPAVVTSLASTTAAGATDTVATAPATFTAAPRSTVTASAPAQTTEKKFTVSPARQAKLASPKTLHSSTPTIVRTDSNKQDKT